MKIKFTKLALLFLATLSAMLQSCNPSANLDLSGKTLRNINAALEPNSTADNSDWRLTDAFTNAENQLFVGSNSNTVCGSAMGDSLLAYPNPSNGILFLAALLTTPAVSGEFVIVDVNMNVLKRVNTGSGTALQLDFSDEVANGDEVRLYYKIANSNCNYQGHGDLKIVK
jgi:hypothetical protein